MAHLNISNESIPKSKIQSQSYINYSSPTHAASPNSNREYSAKSLNLSSSPLKSTAKSQRPLRRLQLNQVLLEWKLSISDCDSKEKREHQKLLKRSVIDAKNGEGNTLLENESTSKSKPTEFAIQSDSESDNTLADIEFWTAPRCATRSIICDKLRDESLKTPRARRAETRQIRQIEEKGVLDLPKKSNYTLSDAKSVTYATHLPESRPTSSYGGDPCALLKFEPAPKASPVKAPKISRPLTPPAPLDKPTSSLNSPSKLPRIPQPPFHQSVDEFWSQSMVNDWNDQYSPQKLLKSPRRKQLAEAESSSDEFEGYISPSASPRKGPSKIDKAARDARKAFDSTKRNLADDFLQRLDSKITNGKISELTQDTGGVRLIWSKKLNSTAGRASWRREATIKKQSDGSVDKTYKHYASIELAEKVIDEEHRLYNTLAHEFCHLANFMISEVKDNPHGKEFKEWGKKCTKAFSDLGVEVTTKHSYAIDYKYMWECVECGTEFKRHSKSIDPKKHRCGRCKSQLVQTKPAVRVAKASEYQLFVKEHFQRLRRQNAKESHAFVMKLVGELYREQKAKTAGNIEAKSMDQLVNGLDAISLGI